MLELRKHFVFVVLAAAFAATASAQQTPAGLKVAFTGDQSLGSDPEEVLLLIKAEGAEALFIQGDFDYSDDPAAWEAMLDGTLGANFPVIALVGNHDEAAWYGAGGYQERLTKRMQRTGVPWLGELGVQATVNYKGLFVVQTAAGVFDDYDHAAFIRKSLADDSSIWSISGWHKLMADMQVGGKGDETGWEVYEESRRGGAIIATAHEHSYSRTHLLSNMESRTVASTAQPLVLSADDTATTGADEGRSFAFVSGLGGSSIRDQERTGDWWASVYTSTQGASNGALFAVFNVNNDPRLAHFYFKDVNGKVVDDFTVRSALGQAGPPPTPTTTTTTTVPVTSTTTTTTAPAATSTTTTTVPAAATSTTTTTVPAAATSTTTTTVPAAATSTTTTTVPVTPTTSSPSTTSTTVPPTPGPAPTPSAACSDDVDNDGDKRIDYPRDKGCDSPDDPYEEGRRRTRRLLRKQGITLAPATTAPLGACWDGLDNDGDGRVDFPKDKGCDSPDDPYELNRPQTRRLLEGLDL